MPVTIEYIPLIKGNVVHTKQLNVTQEELDGITLMALLLKDVYYIKVTLSNGEPAVHMHEDGSYSAKILGRTINFNDLDMIGGVILVCLLFGFPPIDIIKDIRQDGDSIDIDLDYYFSYFHIDNLFGVPDGVALSTEHIRKLGLAATIDSITELFQECFPGVSAGITVPSDVFIISVVPDHKEVVAICVVDPYLPTFIKGTYEGAYHISDVCTGAMYRGRGLAKSLLVCMLNNLINKGITKFILEVLQDNTAAYSLYTSLGFKKIQTYQDGKSYDVLMLDL